MASRADGGGRWDVQKTFSSGIFINEILPSPLGADDTDEWMEIYNSNNFEVDLSGWKTTDKEGTISTYVFPKDTKIAANGFLVLKRPATKIMLNNDKDGLTLFAPDGKAIQSISFFSAPKNQSYNNGGESWAWSATLTPGSPNKIILTEAKPKNPLASSGPDGLPNSKKSDNNIIEAKDLTAGLNQTASPWFLFFTVSAITIIFAGIVLFIKFKFLKNHVGS